MASREDYRVLLYLFIGVGELDFPVNTTGPEKGLV